MCKCGRFIYYRTFFGDLESVETKFLSAPTVMGPAGYSVSSSSFLNVPQSCRYFSFKLISIRNQYFF